MINKATQERRQYERYRIKEDHRAYVALRPKFKQIGQMKDISQGGLCFEYLFLNDLEPLSNKESAFSVDIFIAENGFYLSGVKCKPAYDINYGNDHPSLAFGLMERRKCGLKFDELTENQKKQINTFMELYTEGTA